MKIIQNYIKYGLCIVCGLIVGSLIHSAIASESKVIEAEGEHTAAISLRDSSTERLGNVYDEMYVEIEKVKDRYRPYIEDEEKVNNHANELVCIKEVALAKAKLGANLEDELELTEEDVKRLSEKILWVCVKEEVVEEIDLVLEEKKEAWDEAAEEVCVKHTAGEDQNQYVRLASEISGNDIDFLTTLDQENALWDPNRKALGNEDAWGFCQFNRRWHSATVDDERFFTDPEWQMNKCYDAYIGGVRFYGYDKRANSVKNFTCPLQS